MKLTITLSFMLFASIVSAQNWLYPTKNLASEEAGVAIRNGASVLYYLYSDNSSNDFNIQSTAVAGENDGSPRIRLPYASPNVLLALSGGNVAIGHTSPQAKLHISNGDLLLQNATSGYPRLWL